MALQRWAFFYTSPGAPLEGAIHVATTPSCRTVLVGVPRAEAALPIAERLVAEVSSSSSSAAASALSGRRA